MYSTANLSDKELKEQGNRLFSLRKYEEAINCYSKAIVSFLIDDIFFKWGYDLDFILDKKSRCSSLFYK